MKTAFDRLVEESPFHALVGELRQEMHRDAGRNLTKAHPAVAFFGGSASQTQRRAAARAGHQQRRETKEQMAKTLTALDGMAAKLSAMSAQTRQSSLLTKALHLRGAYLGAKAALDKQIETVARRAQGDQRPDDGQRLELLRADLEGLHDLIQREAAKVPIIPDQLRNAAPSPPSAPSAFLSECSG